MVTGEASGRTHVQLVLIPNLIAPGDPAACLPPASLSAIRSLTHFVVETPKVARAFLKAAIPQRPVANHEIVPIEPFAAAQDAVLAWWQAGHAVGLISDAGVPGVADPGAALVALAHRKSVPIVPLVGPSSILLALMASGMNGQHFEFLGYLPQKPREREQAITSALGRAHAGCTQICIETPYRNASLLGAILQVGHSARAGALLLGAAQALGSATPRILVQPLSAWQVADVQAFDRKEPCVFLLGRST